MIPLHSKYLMCDWMSVEPEGESILRIDVPKNHCVNMAGCIKFAKRIMPNVQKIRVLADNLPDSEYVRSGRRWVANDVRPMIHA